MDEFVDWDEDLGISDLIQDIVIPVEPEDE